MADRAVQITPGLWAGAAAAALVLCLTLGTLAAVFWRAEGGGALGPADWAAVRFTLSQAALSALISVALGILAARALARRRFIGRGLLITLLGAPFILPVIVAVLGLLAVFGRAGLVSDALVALGLPVLDIYGLGGVVLAHVFFNLPLATRLILQGWQSIPTERFRLAAALNFDATDTFSHLEQPMLRAIAPGAFMVIFVICTTSFAVALTLGGGPRATTVELAIYQAFRFDFDLGRAAVLALVQFAICAVAAGLAFWVAVPERFGAGLDRGVQRFDAGTRALKLQDGAVLVCVALFLLVPLAMVIAEGAPRLFALPQPVWEAALRSVLVALASTVLVVLLAFPMALSITRLPRGGGVLDAIGTLSIASSPLVIGTGLFVLIFPIANPQALALPVTAVVNAVMALPFVLRILVPEMRKVERDHGPLADSLALTGFDRLRFLHLPRLRRPLGFGAGLAAALSMGDLGVVALFADPQGATLPLMLYRLMGAYRMADAAGAALLLLALSLALFWAFDRGGRIDADT